MPRDPNVQSLLNRLSKLEGALGFITQGRIIHGGNGVPTFAAQSGSWYIRSDGSSGARIYVNQGGTSWSAIPGV